MAVDVRREYVEADQMDLTHPEIAGPMRRIGCVVAELLEEGITHQQLANILLNFHVQAFATLNPTDEQIIQVGHMFTAHVTEVRDGSRAN